MQGEAPNTRSPPAWFSLFRTTKALPTS